MAESATLVQLSDNYKELYENDLFLIVEILKNRKVCLKTLEKSVKNLFSADYVDVFF
ncbi:MAG: hypothetical protein GY760_03640 [Deltaproteobacteria bacterium]|nr:hypothetical protein [Deltaproteobacteria bacterium]